MLYCRPKWEYRTDDDGWRHFRKLRLKIWDDKDYFDPSAIRRNEEYEDIDEAIARLDEFIDEPSFDSVSRAVMSMFADLLRRHKKDGVLPPANPRLKWELQAALDKVFGKPIGGTIDGE